MGSVIYDFLADSLFLHQNSIKNGFKKETDSKIEYELQNYRDFCIKNYHNLINEINTRDSFLKVFSSAEKTSINLLKQTALYIDQFIIPDPLFKQTDHPAESSEVTAKYLGYLENNSIDRQQLSKAGKYLREITPMIAGNYVKIFPLSYHFEAPKEISINMPKDYYNGILPDEIMKFFWNNVSVKSMEKSEAGGWRVVDGKLYPCRSIAVDFKGDNFISSMIYHLFEIEVDKVNEDGTYTFRFNLPESIPEENYFKAWVTQSINSASKAYFDKIYIENYIASNLKSTYLCDNEFTSKLISQNYNIQDSIQTYTANQIINFELPFIDNIDIDKLMQVREFDANVFTNFRIELEKHFRELRTITDPKLLKTRTENIFHEINDVQIQKLKQRIGHINKQVAVNSALALGGLLGSFQTGGYSLLATALALGKGYKDYMDYKESVKENPSYLLWKIQK